MPTMPKPPNYWYENKTLTILDNVNDDGDDYEFLIFDMDLESWSLDIKNTAGKIADMLLDPNDWDIYGRGTSELHTALVDALRERLGSVGTERADA
jgi:hypothetical protein